MYWSTPGFPIHHQLPELAQIHVHRVSDAHPTISTSVVPFSSRLQSFPASGSFQMSQFFSSGGKSIGVLASALVLPMNIQDWFPLGLTGWQESLRRNGVATIVNKRVRNAGLGCNLKNSRMISVHFQGKPFNIMVIQVNALASISEEGEVEPFYEDLQDLLVLTLKKDVVFIIVDWNAKGGSKEMPQVTGKFHLGVQNEAGQRLIEFCQENELVIANTLFKQHKRRLYTWTSPDGWHWNQIDYILCSQR